MPRTGMLVTGGTAGIGLETAVALAEAGHDVVAVGRSEVKADLARRRFAAEGVGDRANVLTADMTAEEDVVGAVERASERSRLVGVAAFAGGSDWLGPLVAVPVEDWRRVVDGNLTSAFLTVKHAGRAMAQSAGGSIVLVSSISGWDTHRLLGPYAVAKSAIESLCRLASAELGASEVRVNTVRPGLIETGLVSHITSDPAALDLFVSQQSLGRVGRPDDIVRATMWLLSESSSFVTGEVLAVDGGSSARRGPDLTYFARELYSPEELAGCVNEDGPTNWRNRSDLAHASPTHDSVRPAAVPSDGEADETLEHYR